MRKITASSALMVIGHIFLCYILFFTFNKPFGYGATVLEKNKSHSLPSLCSSSEKGMRGACSRFGRKESAVASRRILVQDERRVQVMNSRSYNRRKAIGEGDSGDVNSLVRVGFGTPVQYFNLGLDTGSYVTWVRCQSCWGSRCPQQNRPLYNPFDSVTLDRAPCYPECGYSQSYADGSTVDGRFVVDTLFTEQGNEIRNFKFLCGHAETESFGNADGILGLGLGSTQVNDFLNYAFTFQTRSLFQNVFCYCLPASENSGVANAYFGEEAYKNCPFSGSSTPLQSNPSDDPYTASKYFVTLNAITIGNKTVEISSGTIMDSGTIITRLPSLAYSELSLEFAKLMLASGFQNVPAPDDSDNVLDTCYNLEGSDNSAIPNMILHFDNLDVPLDQPAVTWKENGTSKVCLAFAAIKDDDFTIIGSHQLQTRNILYNIPGQRLEIGPPGNC